MAYKKYHYRNGKRYGPYYYKSYRDENGIVRKKYMGSKDPNKKDLFPPTKIHQKINTKKIYSGIFILIFLLFFSIFAFTQFIEINNYESSNSTSGNIVKTFSKPLVYPISTISGYIVSENTEVFDSEVVDLEIKESVEILGKVVSENKNKRMDFQFEQGGLRLYFDLLNYSEFVENVVDEINSNALSNVTKEVEEVINKTEEIETIINETLVEEEVNITQEVEEEVNITQEVEEEVNKEIEIPAQEEVPEISDESVEPSSKPEEQEEPAITGNIIKFLFGILRTFNKKPTTGKVISETNKKIVSEIEFKDIKEKIQEMNKNQVEEIAEQVVIDAEDFDIIVNKTESKAINNESKKADYKWGYKVKLNDLNFMAKIEVSAEEKIEIYNENSLKIGKSILSFKDLVDAGYKVRIEKPGLEIEKEVSLEINEEIFNQTKKEIANETIDETRRGETIFNDSEENITQENENNLEETDNENITELVEKNEVVEQKEKEIQQENEELLEEQVEELEQENNIGITGNIIKGILKITGNVVLEKDYENKISVYIERDFTNNTENISIGDIINLDPSLIILIIKAQHLDENKNFISDIYEQVKEQDNNWSETISNNEYVRITFEQELDKTKDITIYGRSVENNSAGIEVYREDGDEVVAVISNVSEESWYKTYLDGSSGVGLVDNESLDVFDLKIINNAIEFDYIVDPQANDTSNNVYQCGTLDTPGSYVMNQSITNNSLTGDCIIINAQNITLDCAGYYISSTANQTGIYSNKSNTTIKNCNISMGTKGRAVDIEAIGIEIAEGADNSTIINNTIISEMNYGIVLGKVGAIPGRGPDYLLIENNSINITGNAGIYLTYASNNILKGNNIINKGNMLSGEGGQGVGINLGHSSNNTLTNNTGISSLSIAISLIYSNNCILTNNTGISSTYYGIYLDSCSGNNLTNNLGISNLSNGIYLRSVSSYNHLLINNIGMSNLGYGIQLYGVNNNTLINNTGTSNTSIGIFLWGPSNTILIRNRAEGYLAGSYGIALLGTDNNIFQDCINTSGVTEDVYVYTDAGNTNNTFINCSYNISKESVNGAGNDLTRKWYYRSYVNDSDGNPVLGANVTAFNVSDDYQFNYTTNSSGYTPRTEIIEYVNLGGNRTYYSNYTIYADNISLSDNHTYNVTANENNLKDVFTLSETTPLDINITYPLNTSYGINVSNLNYTVSENTGKCWWSNNSGVWNSTPVNAGVNWTGLTSIEGSNNWSVYCNDSSGNENSSSITFYKETTGLNVSVCRNLNQANSEYNQTSDIFQGVSNANCITISAENITYNGNNKWINGTGSWGIGIFSNQTNTSIKDCKVDMWSGYAVKLYNSNNSHVFNCSFYNQGDGIWIVNSSYLTLEDINSTGNSWAIYAEHIMHSNINNINSYDDYYGISLRRGSENNTISNSFINYTSGYGISLSVSDNNLIENNILQNVGDDGIYISSSDNNILQNNTINSSGDDGIQLVGSLNNTINDTTSVNNGNNGLYIYSYSNNNTISNYYTTNNTWYGIEISSFSKDNLIKDSNFSLSLRNDTLSYSNSTNNIFVNCSYNISREDIRTGSSFIRKYYYRAYVNDSNGNDIDGANVTAFNITNDYQFNYTTNSSGYTPRTEITEYVNLGGNRTYYSNYNITAIKSGYALKSNAYNVTANENNLKHNLELKENIILNITINYPTSYLNTTLTSINFNITALDNTLVDSCWFTLNSGVINYTMINSTTKDDYNYTNSNMGDGNYLAKFYCNDSSNNMNNSESVNFTIDSEAPYWNNLRNFNYTINKSFSQTINATDSGFGVENYWLNDSSYFTINKTTGLIENITNLSRTEIHYLNISVNDSLGNINSDVIYINISEDITGPVVNLISPANSTSYTSNSQLINFNYNINETNNVSNCSLIINGVINVTNNSIDKSASSLSISQTFTPATYNWNINCSDEFRNIGNSSVRSFMVSAPSEDDSSSGGTGGGTEPLSEKDFSISTQTIGITLVQGDLSKKTFTITNTEETSQSFQLSIDSNLKEFISISEESFSLNSNQTKTITLTFNSNETAKLGVYTGNLKIKTTDKEKEILITYTIKEKEHNFLINTQTMEISLTQGNSSKKIITINNPEKLIQSFQLIISPDLKEFISISEESFSLNSNQTKTITLTFNSNETAKLGVYTGNLKIKTTDKEKEILITYTIKEKEIIEEEIEEKTEEKGEEKKEKVLFDVSLEIPEEYKEISPGENLPLKVTLINLGDPIKTIISIDYIVKDYENNMILKKQDKVNVETKLTLSKEIKLPENLIEGDYVAIAEIKYNDLSASASGAFKIKKTEYVLLEFEYEKGGITFINKTLEKGMHPTTSHDSGKEYEINLYSSKRELLYTTFMNSPGNVFSDVSLNNETVGEVVELGKTKFYVIIPEDKKSEKIEILKNKEEVLEEEVYNIGAKSCRIR